jgi:hypothetical protein
MRNNKSHLKVVAVSPPLPVKRTDTPDNSSDTYYEERRAAVRWGWLRQFRRLRKSDPEPTLAEIKSIEARVRKKLYP